jgi:hypothetical protein
MYHDGELPEVLVPKEMLTSDEDHDASFFVNKKSL